MSERSCDPQSPWLTLIGLGEDGPAGLGPQARHCVETAEVVFGGKRHLALLDGVIKGKTHAWQSPLSLSIEALLALRGSRVTVLASGDPFLYGIGATLSRHLPAKEIRALPAPSAFSMAAARLAWPLQDCLTLSLHGRPISLIRPHLHEGRRILALTSDENGPSAIAVLLTEAGFGSSHMTVLEALGGPRERRRETLAAHFDLPDVDPLNLCAIEVTAEAGAAILPFAPGLPDDCFEHDGQITKSEIRAMTISALAPRHGERLWDVGAGAGSVAIEWMLCDPSLQAIAIEGDASRAARILRNAEALGVPGLEVIAGTAPAAYENLPMPDAVFIGGGGSEPGVLDGAIAALKPGGRLVANAVTLDMEAVLLDRQARLGGGLLRIALSRAAAVGSMSGWRPAMPVTQWRWTKPAATLKTDE